MKHRMTLQDINPSFLADFMAKVDREHDREEAKRLADKAKRDSRIRAWSEDERAEVAEERAIRRGGWAMRQPEMVRPTVSKASRTAGRARLDGQDRHGYVVHWTAEKIREVYGA